MADRSINDIPPQVKELSNIHDSSDTEEMEDGILSHLNPNPNPIPGPCEASTRIKITEDLTLIFLPRIKLNIMIVCQDNVIPMIMDEDTFISIATIRFRDTKFFRKEISLPSEDIRMHVLLPPKRVGGNLEAVAEGSFFFRDLNLKSRELLMKAQKKLLQKLGTFEVKYCGSVYEIRVLSPAFSEDSNEMMASVSGLTEDPPTILLKGIPSHWFAEQPDSSEPSKRLLRIFLETFGEVRYLDTSENDADAKYCNVAIQYANYEDCRKALNQLCSFSLQKAGDSRMTADYEVTWKDYLVPVSQEEEIHLKEKDEGSPSKPGTEDPLEELKAIKHQMAELQKQIERLEAKLEA